MKKTLFFTIVLTIFAFTVNATIWTVSNNPDSPGQYTSLQMAIDSSMVHDTILVAGSPTSYGNITLKWSLTLIGAGYNNEYGYNTTVGNVSLTRVNVSIGASDTRIMGFAANNISMNGYYSGGSVSTNLIENVVVERCSASSIYIGNPSYQATYNNDTVRNCLVNNTVSFYGGSSSIYNNTYIHNNIFNGAGISSTYSYDLSTAFVKNNIFLNRNSDVFSNVHNLVIENNIFYQALPQGAINCAYNNNITFMNNNNVIPGPGNVGSGNFVDVDPEFVDFPFLGAPFSYAHNYNLQPTSPGIAAGTDGTDIGIYGGMLPFEIGANPYIPQMMEVSLPSGSSVPAGGTLNVHFKAKKQD
jgi:hypothetical protein